jgi:hypothetical protein
MSTPRYTLLRVVAYVLELLAVVVLVVSFVPGIADMPWFGEPAASVKGETASPMGAWFLTLIAAPYAIVLYAAGQLILLLIDTRLDVHRLARRLDELHPPERS